MALKGPCLKAYLPVLALLEVEELLADRAYEKKQNLW